MLIIYGAYVPHKRAEIQRVVCIKFKSGTTAEDMEKHMRDFASMKNSVDEVVAYSAGHVQKSAVDGNQFDVVHYLTFRTVEGADKYVANADRKAFVKANEGNWDKVLEINSNIEK
ncbi:Dabb family protein [Dyadobacter sandarakinus]|uniref:Dabb family protein n=2 Tax=Dyadobacter sandarakinus TaxID=2747268 RepID=A0ABX7IFW9_9BACT|nr:Dabb family protein [Dyadobacter sandarakinus]